MQYLQNLFDLYMISDGMLEEYKLDVPELFFKIYGEKILAFFEIGKFYKI